METKLYNWKGDQIAFDEYADRHIKKKGKRGLLIASDMDNSMFDCDLGILVFLEKLNDPKFWDFDQEVFASLVMPKKYHQSFCEGSKGHPAGPQRPKGSSSGRGAEGSQGKHSDNLTPELCTLALRLHKDVVRLYRDIQHSAEGKEDARSGAVVEFARKMIELDRAFMEADRYLSKLFKGELLMRTRFFAGKEQESVQQLTKDVMRREKTSIDRFVDLKIPKGQLGDVSEDEISEAYGIISPWQRVDRYVPTIQGVQEFIQQSVENVRTIGIVVTTNLQSIATTAVRNSEYAFLKDQEVKGKHLRGAVIGSKLIKNGAKFGPKMQGLPIFGEQKTLKAEAFARKNGKSKLACAIGDSPSNDGPMLRASLEKGGTAIIVGPELEALKRRFASALNIEDVQGNAQERVYYILTQNNPPQ